MCWNTYFDTMRKKVSVGSLPADASHGHHSDLSVIDAVDVSMREKMWQSLNKHLTGLEVLLVDDVWCRAEDRESGIEPLILKHADTLRHLSVDLDLPLPVDGKQFSKLETVRCHFLPEDVRAVCPVLKDVTETRDDEDWNSSISGGHYDPDDLDGIYNPEDDRDWEDGYDYDEFDNEDEDDDFYG